jgi:ABC-type branched-subunit amino acid transport system ATPase component/branched-subunit amino acid ABC-type transport system permease component
VISLLRFALLGLGPGAIYAMLGLGVVVVHRGSGVVNFAGGAVAMSSGFVFYSLQTRFGVYGPLAALLAVLFAGLVGLASYLLVLRFLTKRSILVQIIATLGVMVVLQSSAELIYGTDTRVVKGFVPSSSLTIGSISIGWDRLILLALATLLTYLLTLFYRHTRSGLATTALSDSALAVATQGHDGTRLSALTWGVGGILAGLSGVLVTPITGLQVGSVTLLIVEALAAALIGSLTSLWGTLAGALVIGVLESETTNYVSVGGASAAVPLIAIILVLVLRGRHLPERGHVTLRLPSVGASKLRPGHIALASILVIVSIWTWLPSSWTIALMITTVTAVMCLSVVVITGLTGQISLAQFALVGVGALAASWVNLHWHWPFLLCLVAAVVACIPCGMVLAAVSFRVRGRNLALVTLAVAAVMSVLVFNIIQQIQVSPPAIFGLSVDPVLLPRRYATVCVVVFVLLGVLVANLRRSKLGLQLLAVRANETAAGSLGVNVAGAKTYGFVVASVIAGAGGALVAFQNYFAVFTNFDVFGSINLVVWTVLGGVGFIAGSLVGGVFEPGGLGTRLGVSLGGSVQDYLPLIGGVAVIVMLIVAPDGLVPHNRELLRIAARRLGLDRFAKAIQGRRPDLFRRSTGSAGRRLLVAAPAPPEDEPTAGEVVLDVAHVSVSFGGVHALRDVSLDARAGEVVGLIGPNGAGKTTLIDVITGMASPNAGTVSILGTDLSGRSVHDRSRHGLGRSFQSLELFEDMTAGDNLAVATSGNRPLDYVWALFLGRKPPLAPAVQEAIRVFELEDDLERMPGDLSFGRRRLLAVARALAGRPRVLLLDEPAAGLSEAEVENLGRLIRRTAHELAVSVIIVEHNIGMVTSVCDRIIVLDDGAVIGSGDPFEIQNEPAVLGAYLGHLPAIGSVET